MKTRIAFRPLLAAFALVSNIACDEALLDEQLAAQGADFAGEDMMDDEVELGDGEIEADADDSDNDVDSEIDADVELLELEDGTDVHMLEHDGVTELAAAPDVVEASAPSCLALAQWRSNGTSHARATNKCGSSVRARMIWAYANDGLCRQYAPGAQRLEGRKDAFFWGQTPYVNQLRKC